MNLTPVEFKGQKILTSQQLADGYETDIQVVANNFNRNKDRYILGKHYYLLKGEELKEFKTTTNQFELPLKINKLYLWTEKGALLHAKSLNTDKAWEVYDMLVDNYFRVPKNNELQVFKNNVNEDIKAIRENLSINGARPKQYLQAIKNTVKKYGIDIPNVDTPMEDIECYGWTKVDSNGFPYLEMIMLNIEDKFLQETSKKKYAYFTTEYVRQLMKDFGFNTLVNDELGFFDIENGYVYIEPNNFYKYINELGYQVPIFMSNFLKEESLLSFRKGSYLVNKQVSGKKFKFIEIQIPEDLSLFKPTISY